MRIRMPRARRAVDRLPSTLESTDAPSVVESEVSSVASLSDIPAIIRAPKRLPLQWEFKGLTVWLEFEEFNGDLTRANEFLASHYGTEVIPCVHATAIYGMQHLSVEEAKERLLRVPSVLPNGTWPVMDRPVAVKQDISQEGLPGQVCSIAWAELTLKTNEAHEVAMDTVHQLFEMERGKGRWTPHISLAYDNPEDSVLELIDIITYVSQMPSLMKNSRRVKALSLWSTEGKMGDWQLLERVKFYDYSD